VHDDRPTDSEQPRSPFLRLRSGALVLAVAAALATGVLAGCGNNDSTTGGGTVTGNAQEQAEEGVESAEKGIEEGKDKAEKGIEEAKEKFESSKGSAKESFNEARDKAEEAGEEAKKKIEEALP
jgi:hypothetical protein